MKSDAITLIKQAGSCVKPENIPCMHCCIAVDCAGKQLTNDRKYELAVKVFIKECGRDALVEALL